MKFTSKFKIGQKVKYTKEYMFGKTGNVTATVVLITGKKVLLDNGDSFYNLNK